MSQVKIVLILTENWTMRPVPDVADLVRFAIEAERAGLDAVMVSEHVVLGPSADAAGRPANPRDYALPGNQDPATPWPSPLVLLSASAAATTRLRLVAGALISPLRHPLTTAKDLATLDRREALLVRAHLGRATAGRPGGPDLWFGGSSLHPRLIARLVRYGSGFNPLGPAGDLAPLAAAMAAAGRRPDELEYVGGTRGDFPGPDAVADLDRALSAVPAQLARGFTTICVKPSQFVDDTAAIGAFCRSLAARAASLGES